MEVKKKKRLNFVLCLKMWLSITELNSVVCDKSSKFDESFKDIKVKENNSVKIYTTENNLLVKKKIKGKN